jgi:hypothetical protein
MPEGNLVSGFFHDSYFILIIGIPNHACKPGITSAYGKPESTRNFAVTALPYNALGCHFLSGSGDAIEYSRSAAVIVPVLHSVSTYSSYRSSSPVSALIHVNAATAMATTLWKEAHHWHISELGERSCVHWMS